MDTRGRHLTMNINMGLNKLLVSSTVWSYSDEDRLVVWSNMTDFFWRIMKHKWFYIVKKQHILLARCAVLCTMPKTKTCKTQKSFKWYIPYVYCGYFTTELLSSITLWLEPFQKFKFLFCFFSCHQLVYEKWEALALPNQISLLFSLSYTHFNSGAAAVAIRICRPPLHVALSSYCSSTMWRKLREKISQTQSDLMGPFSRHLQHWLCESLRGAITDNIKLNKDEKWHFRSPCRCDV